MLNLILRKLTSHHGEFSVMLARVMEVSDVGMTSHADSWATSFAADSSATSSVDTYSSATVLVVADSSLVVADLTVLAVDSTATVVVAVDSTVLTADSSQVAVDDSPLLVVEPFLAPTKG